MRYVVLPALLALILCAPLSAHDGPPFPLFVDRTAGPFLVSVWADPDVGIGTFLIFVKSGDGNAVPEDLKVQVAVKPASGRLQEVEHDAIRQSSSGRDGRLQFKAEISFDAQEIWDVRFLFNSSRGSAETAADVSVTPPGLGRWDLLIYVFPFLLIGVLWIRGILRGRASTTRSHAESSKVSNEHH